MNDLLYEFSLVDGLAIFLGLPFWVLLGMALVDEAPRLVRYTWGVVGGLVLLVGLLVYHGLIAWLWLIWLPAGVGLGTVALAHRVRAARDAGRHRRAAQRAAQARGPEGD